MTRINLVPVTELCDQHLLAEWRELPRMGSFALRAKGAPIPPQFTLGTGHMRFFLDKGEFLEARHRALTAELLRRHFVLKNLTAFSMPATHGRIAWQPTADDVQRSWDRIIERMPAKPRYCKQVERLG